MTNHFNRHKINIGNISTYNKIFFKKKENVFDFLKKIDFADLFLYTGTTLLNFFALLFIFTQIFFYCNITVNYFTIIISFICSFLVPFLSIFYRSTHIISKTERIKLSLLYAAKIISICAILIIISIMLGSAFIDDGYDSNAYHKPYSLFFIHGWNPITGSTPDVFGGKIIVGDHKGNTYPKAVELIASYIYLCTKSLESVKAVNFIIFFASLTITYSAFSLFFLKRKYIALIISILAVSNPIWLMQSTQFYNDGFVSELFLILISLILLFIKGNAQKYTLLSLLLGLTLLLSSKGSALLFVPILITLLGTLTYLYKKESFRYFPAILLILGFLFCITAYSPYISNYITTKSPLGSEFSKTTPESYTKEYTGFSNDNLPGWMVPRALFLLSLFSSPSQSYTGLNNPFEVSLADTFSMTGEDKINGFGPLIGLITLITVIGLLFIIRTIQSEDERILLISIFFIFLSVILHTACWWARMVPQFYLIPVFVLAITLLKKSSVIKVISALLVILLLINMILISYHSYTRASYITDHYEDAFSHIKSNAALPVGLKNTFPDNSFNLVSPVSAVLLDEKGIPWELCDPKNGCPEGGYRNSLLFFTDVYYYPKSN